MIVSEPVIRMENIIKRYYIGKPNELQILNGISLSVDQGEFVSIVGESGSGKSTLMNIIGVLDRQTEGTYFLEGKDVNKMDDSMRSAIKAKIGVRSGTKESVLFFRILTFFRRQMH